MFMKMNPRTSVSNHNHHQQSQYHRHHNVDDDIDANRIVKCTLNEDQCLSLEDILRSFQTSINEEQAWALCYQMVKCFRQYYQSTKNASQYCYLITDPSHVLIHKDGHVHPKTLHLKTIQGTSRTLAKSSHKLLTSLGIVLFRALDYGLCEDEERTLSKPLELLIERLTKANELATNNNNSRHQKNNINNSRHQQTSSSSTTSTTTTTTATGTTIIIPATTTSSSSSSTTTTTTTLNHHRANAARPASNGVQKPKNAMVGAAKTTMATTLLVQSSSANNNNNNNNHNNNNHQVKISNNDHQMNSIGSMYYDEEDENDHGADGSMIDDDDDDDDDGGDHRLEDEEDEDDEEEDVVAEDEEEEEEEDDDDDDECANADEGIDCHEYGDDNHHLLDSHQTSFDGDHQMANALFKFDQVMQMCVSRLSSRESADNHYKAVCRALLAETLELSTFLDQIVKGTKELKKSSVLRIESTSTTNMNNDHNDSTATLDDLQFHDWARLWIQVIRELRHGVKLKKVDQEDLIHNTEYELTPYEMLLDDIRSRRYKLNKVMVNGDLPPRVKKDAHELILDFIRSRPPLVPVAQRVLKPAPEKKVTLYERLMESIRQEHKLRPTPKPTMKMYSLSAHVTPIHHPATIDEDDSGDGGSVTTMDRGRKNSTTSIGSAAAYNNNNNNNSARRPSSSSRRKKVIKADIQLDLFSDDDDDHEDEQRILSVVQLPTTRTRSARSASTANTRPRSAYFPSEMDFNYLNDDHDHDHDDHVVDDNTSNNHNHNGDGDGDADSRKNGAISDGNHSVSSAGGNRTILRLKKLSSQFFSKERRHSISVCDLKALEQHQKQQEQLDRDLIEDLDFNEDARNHVASIWSQNDFGRSLECLSLTLKEVQHIRSVLTKAEIESLGVTKTLKKDLENGKICFTCLKTRFTFWGPWATICKLCNRAICDRCATKMHIPVEQFDRVPIYMLSPTPSPPNERHVLDIFKFASSASDGGSSKPRPSTSTSTKHRPSTTSDAQQNAATKSLPSSKPESETSGNRMMRLVRLLTINNNNNSNADATTAMTSDHDDDQDGQDQQDGGSLGETNPKPEPETKSQSQSNKTSGPLVKVCRDCKILVRHLIDIGHTNFGAGKFQNGFPAQ